jgi:hypothetical protein
VFVFKLIFSSGDISPYLAVGDSGGNLHIVQLPSNFNIKIANEVILMKAFYERESKRFEYFSNAQDPSIQTQEAQKVLYTMVRATQYRFIAESVYFRILLQVKEMVRIHGMKKKLKSSIKIC